MTQPFLQPNFFPFFFFNTFLSSKALGRDPDHSDQEEVIVSGSDTESDHEESKDSSQERADETTAATPPPNESSQDIITEASAPPIDSASQEIELPPLLSDPEKSLPETELIERDFDQMEAELTQSTADKQTQVSSFAIIC